MDKTKKPKKIVNLLDSITPEDLEKIKAHQGSTQGVMPVDDAWLLMTEFAITFGWDAYKEARDNKIPLGEMLTLLSAARKLNYERLFTEAQTSFIGAVSAKTNKPWDTFKRLTKNIVNQSKADK